MSSIHKNWISLKDFNSDKKLSSKSNLSPILKQLLVNRNILTEKEIEIFLKPAFKDLYSPKLLPNIDNAVKRINKAVKDNEKILIFGDYDTDGIISTALIYNFLKKIGACVEFFIPDRFEDGYDINLDFIRKKTSERKYNLIICVDCGTNAHDVKQYIMDGKNSIDVIVCDHHEPVEKKGIKQNFDKNEDLEKKSSNQKFLQDIGRQGSYIVINPKLKCSFYPFKNISAAAVVFKLIIAMFKNMEEKLKKKLPQNYLSYLIDMVAISTVADLMPLIDENRVIVKTGLKVLEKTRNNGLKTLIKKTLGTDKKINTHDIGFIIAPRINASGRVKNAIKSLELLIDKNVSDEKTNEKIVNELEKFNDKRQSIQQFITEEILKSYDIKNLIKKQRIFICKSCDWNEGVLGIVASDIVKKFNVPVILFKEDIGKLKGSGRSTECFDLNENLSGLSGYFIKFGGHRQACGITMELEKYDSFKHDILMIANKKITEKDIARKYYYDMEIGFNDIVPQLIKELYFLEPHGIGNPKPLFLTRNCTVAGSIFFSRNEKHAFIKLENGGRIFNSIIFNYKEHEIPEEALREGSSINILYNIESTYSFSNKNYNNFFYKDDKNCDIDSKFKLLIQALC